MLISTKTIKIFSSYASEDKIWQIQLEKHLSGLKQKGLVSHWHHGLISAGEERQGEIDKHLNTAHIILLLVSPDFIASDDCKGEVEKAMKRYVQNEARVIPVILRPIDWKNTEYSKLQPLPSSGKPVNQYSDPDLSLFDVAQDISKVVMQLMVREWLDEGYRQQSSNEKQYNKALEAFENALSYDASCVEAYNAKGDTYYALRDDKEALKAYESARKYDQRSTWAWYGIGNVCLRQRNYEQALDAFRHITMIKPDNPWSAWAWYEQGKIHQRFNNLQEALDAYEKAIVVGEKAKDLALFHRDKGALYEKLEKYVEALAEAEKALSLDPEDISSYRNKGFALDRLGRLDEALEAFEEAIRREPDYSNAHQGKGQVLRQQRKYEEALQEIEEAIRLKADYMWAWKNKEMTLKFLAQQAREKAEKYDKLAQEAHKKAQQLGYNDD